MVKNPIFLFFPFSFFNAISTRLSENYLHINKNRLIYCIKRSNLIRQTYDNFTFLLLLNNILNTTLNNPSISITKMNHPYIYKFLPILINNL